MSQNRNRITESEREKKSNAKIEINKRIKSLQGDI